MNLSPSASHAGGQNGGLNHHAAPKAPPPLTTATIASGAATTNITTNPNYSFSSTLGNGVGGSNLVIDPDSITTTSFYSQFPPVSIPQQQQQQQQQQQLFYEDHLLQQQQHQMLVEDSRNKWHSTGNVPDPRVQQHHHFRTSLNPSHGGHHHIAPNVSEYASVDIQHLPSQQQQLLPQNHQQQQVNGSATVSGKFHQYRSLQQPRGAGISLIGERAARNCGAVPQPPPPSLPSGSAASNNPVFNLGNYFPRIASEPTSRKSYTNNRDKKVNSSSERVSARRKRKRGK